MEAIFVARITQACRVPPCSKIACRSIFAAMRLSHQTHAGHSWALRCCERVAPGGRREKGADVSWLVHKDEQTAKRGKHCYGGSGALPGIVARFHSCLLGPLSGMS